MLSLTSVVPYFVIMALLLVLAWGIVRWVPFYRRLVEAGEAGRYQTLDGLRGFLALAVFFHHSVFNYNLYQTSFWGVCDSQFYRALGPTAVMFFFMITGFLFWSKAIAGGQRVAAWRLYKNRLFRLAPLFLASILVVLAIVAEQSHFRAHIHPARLLWQVVRACSLGIGTVGKINGLETLTFNGGVTWSLRDEWLYYLALPALAFLATPRRFSVMVLVSCAGYACLAHWYPQGLRQGRFLLSFLCGMFAAHVAPRVALSQQLNRWWVAVVVVGLLAGSVLITADLGSLAVSGLAFLSFVLGHRLLGLLTTASAKLLGAISYSIYLLHGIVLYLVLRVTNHFCPITSLDPLRYWVLIAGCGCLVVICSAISYRFIEHPFIDRSHRARVQRAKAAEKSVGMSVAGSAGPGPQAPVSPPGRAPVPDVETVG
jgi:peptidoglycan/LPS O-acetylase OafA/YrhL